jgi:O-6-methylguanine DNA methyltransferase
VDKPSERLYLPLDMRGTAFQRRGWEKLRAISGGRTVTYMGLARWISPLASPCEVAGACAANSIALAVPCHREVGINGDLTGYGWGIELKRQLIKKEVMICARPSRMSSASAASSAEARVTAYDWDALAGGLDSYGCAFCRSSSWPRNVAALPLSG